MQPWPYDRVIEIAKENFALRNPARYRVERLEDGTQYTRYTSKKGHTRGVKLKQFGRLMVACSHETKEVFYSFVDEEELK